MSRTLSFDRIALATLVMACVAACGGRSVDATARHTGDKEGRNVDAGAGDAGEREGRDDTTESDESETVDSEAPNEDSTDNATSTGNDDNSSDVDESSSSDESSGESDPSEPTPNNPDAPQFDCSEVRSQQFDPLNMSGYSVSSDVADKVASTLSAMDAAQKATQLLGISNSTNYSDLQHTSDVEVSGVGTIRGFRIRDVGRGVNLAPLQAERPDDGNNFSTAFPTESLRGASWDLDLERRVGAAMGDETAASHNSAVFGASANILRHPYWGRAQESYGEDSYLIGRMASAFTVGLQEYVMACAKHFTAYNIELGRSNQDATLTEQTLREIYGRQFEMVIRDGGAGCIVAAYNMLNGVKATQNKHLLRDILKAPVADGGMGFEGIVVTDFWAMPGDQRQQDSTTAQAVAEEALAAGTDIELPWALHYTPETLAKADPVLIEDAARRVLTQKYRFNSALDTDLWSLEAPTSTLTEGSITTNLEHEALAEEAALKSIVLLVNGLDADSTVLPLTSTTIAVVGPRQAFSLVSSTVPKSCVVPEGTTGRECTFSFATDPALGDRGSGRVNADPERAVGPFQGIQEAAGADRTVATSDNTAATDLQIAASAEAVVVVVGYTPEDEGEEYPLRSGGDRTSLSLPAGHNELIASVLDLNKPTVIIVESGSIVDLPWLSHSNQKQATVWAGYSGLRGGSALGKLIFGAANFSGKMPTSWPVQDALPTFKAANNATNMGYFFGYREFDRREYIDGEPADLVFPFGHGLSYASFEYANLALPCESVTAEAIINVSVDVSNTSTVDGDEVAMLFVKPPAPPAGTKGERPWKELKSFARVTVPADTTVSVNLPLRLADLRRWEGDETGRWVVDSGDYTILVGRNAADAETSVQGTLSVSGD